jgi:hypothetical protein
MILSYYIIVPGKKRKLKFEAAASLDNYIKSHKLPQDAYVLLQDESLRERGNILVSTYLELYKLEQNEKNA